MTEWPNICPKCKGKVHKPRGFRDCNISKNEVLVVKTANGKVRSVHGPALVTVAIFCEVCESRGTVIGETAKAIE